MRRFLPLCLLLLSPCTPLWGLSPHAEIPAHASGPAAPEPDTEEARRLTPIALVQPPPEMRELVPAPLIYPPRVVLEPKTAIRTQPRQAATSPLHLVSTAQQGARIGPGDPGYRQEGAMHYYGYEVGGVYDIYVSPTMATGMLFPPGEFIKVGLYLPKEDFNVETKAAGEETHTYDALTILPRVDKGEYDAFVLMTNGKAYLFHLIVGKKGMLTVAFDGGAPEARP